MRCFKAVNEAMDKHQTWNLTTRCIDKDFLCLISENETFVNWFMVLGDSM